MKKSQLGTPVTRMWWDHRVASAQEIRYGFSRSGFFTLFILLKDIVAGTDGCRHHGQCVIRIAERRETSSVGVFGEIGQPELGGDSLVSSGHSTSYKYIFGHVKPTDAVVVGMYPHCSGEVKESADLVKKYG